MPRRYLNHNTTSSNFWTRNSSYWPKQMFSDKKSPAHDFPPLYEENGLIFFSIESQFQLRSLVQRGLVDITHPDDAAHIGRLRRHVNLLTGSSVDFLTKLDTAVPLTILTIDAKTRRVLNFSPTKPMSLGPLAVAHATLWPSPTTTVAWALCVSVEYRASWAAKQISHTPPNPILIITPCKYTQSIYRIAFESHSHISVAPYPASHSAISRARFILSDSVPLSLIHSFGTCTALIYNPLEICQRALEHTLASVRDTFTLRLPSPVLEKLRVSRMSLCFRQGLSMEQALRVLKLKSPLSVKMRDLDDVWLTPALLYDQIVVLKQWASSGAQLAKHLSELCSNVTTRELDVLSSSSSTTPPAVFSSVLSFGPPITTPTFTPTTHDAHKAVLLEVIPPRFAVARATNSSKSLSREMYRYTTTCSSFLSWYDTQTETTLVRWLSPEQSCASCYISKPQFICTSSSLPSSPPPSPASWALYCATCAASHFKSKVKNVLPLVLDWGNSDILRRMLSVLSGGSILLLTPSSTASQELIGIIRKTMHDGYKVHSYPYPASLANGFDYEPCAYLQTLEDAKHPILIPRGITSVICYSCPLDLVRRMKSMLPTVVAVGDDTMCGK